MKPTTAQDEQTKDEETTAAGLSPYGRLNAFGLVVAFVIFVILSVVVIQRL